MRSADRVTWHCALPADLRPLVGDEVGN
jgi:hypothetical protein